MVSDLNLEIEGHGNTRKYVSSMQQMHTSNWNPLNTIINIPGIIFAVNFILHTFWKMDGKSSYT